MLDLHYVIPAYIDTSFHREYEWFKKELPGYLFPSPADQDASIVDVDIVREVCEVSVHLSLNYLPLETL